MNYDDPDIVDALAAEYVVGTLRGPARRRFERLLVESASARQAVAHWEGLLGGLGTVLEPVAPPPRAWRRIEAAVDKSRSAAGATGRWSSAGVWRALAGVLAAALLVVALAPLLVSRDAPDTGGSVAIVADAEDRPMWVISADPATGSIRARAVNAQAAAVDRAYELWVLAADGTPRSLGLLPVDGGVARHDIPPALLALLADAQGLAISLEPAGGSPTGAPTGPVLFQAPIVEL